MSKKNLSILTPSFFFLIVVILISGCINNNQGNSLNNNNITPETWKMEEVWNVSTVGIPFMDLRPDGGLAAAIDHNNAILYLAKPNGESKKFNVQENDWGSPLVVGVFIINDSAYVPATYAEFEGARVYTWEGLSNEIKLQEGIVRGGIDTAARSPNGMHVCYLRTGTLYCDDWKFDIGNMSNMLSVSDDGYVVVGPENPILVLKDGKVVSSINASSNMALAYKDKIITQMNNGLAVLNPEGKILASNNNFSFNVGALLKIIPVPSEKYLFAFKAFEKTHVLDWNLKEVRTLPGYPEFANDNFVVTSDNGIIHCYSLKDFHEVFNVTVPGDSIGYIKLSNDGKVMLVSGETGGFYLYRGARKE